MLERVSPSSARAVRGGFFLTDQVKYGSLQQLSGPQFCFRQRSTFPDLRRYLGEKPLLGNILSVCALISACGYKNVPEWDSFTFHLYVCRL